MNISLARLQELTLSNEPPLSSELEQLRSIVLHHTDSAKVTLHGMHIQPNLSSLPQENSQLLDINTIKLIMNPVRRVPTEILCDIFYLFVNEDLESAQDRTITVDVFNYMPWKVAQVSRAWRSVALSFPRLWSIVHIFVDETDLNASRKWGFLLGLQLQRSALHPLSVSICSRCNIPPLHPFLQVLLPSSSRWSELFLWIPCSSFDAVCPIKASLQSLQSLHIWCYFLEGVIPKPTPSDIKASRLFDIFTFAPKLHTLFGHPKHIIHSRLPWLQIRTYHSLFIFEQLKILELLSCMPNLESCSLVCDESDSESETLPQVELTHLRHLSLSGNGAHHVSRLLDYLKLPYLGSLDITGHIDVHSLEPLRFISSLQELRIHMDTSFFFSDEDCRALLMVVPSLRSLILDCPGILIERFINQLANAPSLLPHLQCLTLEGGMDIVLPNCCKLQESRPALRSSVL